MSQPEPALTAPAPLPPSHGGAGRLVRLVGAPAFQRWAARTPGLRRLVRREGEAIFDLMAGFCHTQILTALVELGVLEALTAGPLTARELARRAGAPEDRMAILLRGGAALGLLKPRGERFRLSTRGAALAGVPGLAGMIRHNAVLYRDLADPAAFFRGEGETEMADFWPYVFGAGAADDPVLAERYSEVMAESQTLVAEEVLQAVSLTGVRHLMDVGGGTGAFLTAVGARYPDLARTLFDLPPVIAAARARIPGAGIDLVAGSFRDDPLPRGADAISLVRILFDHRDDTVEALLARVFAALPSGGRLIVAEPMAREAAPARAADAYYALYTLAMGTGRTRTAEAIVALCARAGFVETRVVATTRPFITGVVTACKP